MAASNGETSGGSSDNQTSQIEYLLQQSTQGLHFMFDHSEVARVLSGKKAEENPLSINDMEKVQSLLSGFLEKPTLSEKKTFLDALPRDNYELLVRAYFQLVEKTILAHSTLRH